MKKYVIITPAYNEGGYIAQTVESVLKQTIKPLQWIIVDDGSTDDTAAIINKYAKDNPFIKYHKRQRQPGQTYFSSNVYALQEGVNLIGDCDYDYLAILDADIVLCSDYYEKVFEKFCKYPELGIATGTYIEKEAGKWITAKIDRRSTPKAIQVFIKECYFKCGGYLPFKYGGEDTGMEIMARMNGWQTWSFEDIVVKHLRPAGTGEKKALIKARYRMGIADYCLATHPVFMLFKCVKRAFWEKPLILSSLARFSGYISACLKGYEKLLPDSAQKFIRSEQTNRIKNLFGCGKKMWRPK